MAPLSRGTVSWFFAASSCAKIQEFGCELKQKVTVHLTVNGINSSEKPPSSWRYLLLLPSFRQLLFYRLTQDEQSRNLPVAWVGF